MTDNIQYFAVNDWRIRIEPGRKGPEDTRIGVATRGGEYSVMLLASLGAITSLWYQNEERLYPPPRFYGGKKVLYFLEECCTSDLRTACTLHKLPEPRILRQEDAA